MALLVAQTTFLVQRITTEPRYLAGSLGKKKSPGTLPAKGDNSKRPCSATAGACLENAGTYRWAPPFFTLYHFTVHVLQLFSCFSLSYLAAASPSWQPTIPTVSSLFYLAALPYSALQKPRLCAAAFCQFYTCIRTPTTAVEPLEPPLHPPRRGTYSTGHRPGVP